MLAAMLAGLPSGGEAPPVLSEAPAAGPSHPAIEGHAVLAERLRARS